MAAGRRAGPPLVGDIGTSMARALLTIGLALSVLVGASASPAGAGTVPPMAGPMSACAGRNVERQGPQPDPVRDAGAGGARRRRGVHPDLGRPGRQWRPRLRGQVRGRVQPRQRHTDVLPGRPRSSRTRDVAAGDRYARAGTYHVSVTGYANCGPDRADVTHSVVIT